MEELNNPHQLLAFDVAPLAAVGLGCVLAPLDERNLRKNRRVPR